MAEQQTVQVPGMEDTSAITVETPSRLVLTYSPSLCTNISAHLPTGVTKQPIGEKITIGRSSSSHIRLNDERMSRTYAELWHDGRDPFVFKIQNVSDRKVLMVGSEVLRCGEQSCLTDGCSVKLDFVEFQVKVYAGDFNASSYEISVTMNEIIHSCCQPTSPYSEEPDSIVESRQSFSLVQSLRSSPKPDILESSLVSGNRSSSFVSDRVHLEVVQMPEAPINDLDSGCIVDTSSTYRPNIPSANSDRSVARCQNCHNLAPMAGDREIVYSRGRSSPCENSDVISDGTADDNDIF